MRRHVQRLLTVSTVAVVVGGCGPTPPHCESACTPPGWTTLALLAGQPGGPGFVDGAGPAAHFTAPWSGALDGAGHLFLADGNAIRSIDLGSREVVTLAGSPEFSPTASDGVGAQASFNAPSGVVATATTLYVSDTENDTIRQIDIATATVTTLAGVAGQGGSVDAVGAAARFKEPEGLALDRARGYLYVGDVDNHTIRRVELPLGNTVTLAGTTLVAGNVDAVGVAAQFNKPKAVALDATADHLYIADEGNLSIRKLTLSDNSVTTVATLPALPIGLAVDGASVLVSLDDRVVRADIATGALGDVAGGTKGFVDGSGSAARFSAPAGLVSDGAGTLYVADLQNSAVRTVALASGEVGTLAGVNPAGSSDGTGSAARFDQPAGLAVDRAGFVYVADTNNSAIRRAAIATGEVTTLAGVAGQPGAGDGTGSDARFTAPSGLAFDDAGRLWVVDRGNRNLRLVDVASGSVETPALVAAGTFTGFGAPEAIAVAGGQLYVTDSDRDVVVTIDIATRAATILAGASRMPGGKDGVGADARFYAPVGIVADGAGNLYVADNLSHRVRKVVIATGAVSTVAGSTSGSSDGSTAQFSFPTQLAIDHAGDLFVADSSNHAIRQVALATGAVTTIIGTPARQGLKLGPLPAQLGTPTALALTHEGALVLASEDALLLAR